MKKRRLSAFFISAIMAATILSGGLTESEEACGFEAPSEQEELVPQTPAAAAAECLTEDAESPAGDGDTVFEAAEEAEAPTEIIEEKTPAPAAVFAGKVKIECQNDEGIAANEEVVLKAVVTGANMSYTVSWEYRASGAKPEEPWKQAEKGEKYVFRATEAAAARDYRVCLTTEKQTEVFSEVWNFELKSDNTEINTAPAETAPDAAPVSVESSESGEEPPETEFTEDHEEIGSEESADDRHEAAVINAADEADPRIEEMAAGDTAKAADAPVYENEEEVEPEALTPLADKDEPAEETAESEEYEDQTPADDAQTVTFRKSGEEEFADVNVREDADGMSAIFTSLPEGAEVTVVSIDGDWATVVVNGRQGFIYTGDLLPYLDQAGDAATEEAASEPVMKVTIFSSRRTVMNAGDEVKLTSRLEGFDGFEIMYQWQCDRHDGQGFRDVEGANEDSCTFQASMETLSWDWRLTVYYR